MYVDFERLHTTNLKFMLNLSKNSIKETELLTDISPNIEKKCSRSINWFLWEKNSLLKTLNGECICITLNQEKNEGSDLINKHHKNKKKNRVQFVYFSDTKFYKNIII